MNEETNTPTQDETPQPSQPATSQGSTEGKEGTFTQEDINRISTQVRHETRDIERKKMLEDLGIEDFDSLKTMLSDYTKRKESEMSELEKAQSAIEAANKKAEDAAKELEALKAQRIADGRKNAFEEAIRANGTDQAKTLYTLVNADMSDIFNAVFEDGNTDPDETKMKALVKQVQTKFPMFFGSSGAGSPSNANGVNPSSVNTEEVEKMTRKFRKL